MKTYLVKHKNKEVIVDYDEINLTLTVDDTRVLVLRKSEAYMLDRLDAEFSRNIGDRTWDMLSFWLENFIFFYIKRI